MTTYIQKLLQGATDWLYQSRRRLAIGGVGVLACFIGYHAVFGANGFLVYQDKKTESRKLQHELEALQQDNAQREDRIKALTNDPQTIEIEARKKLNYVRKGDVIYTLPPAKPAPPPKK
jgi:cell division protein FtsB